MSIVQLKIMQKKGWQNPKSEKNFPKRLDKQAKTVYNIEVAGRMQTADRDEYTEKYSRGRRGAPAKGVGRLYRRESSNLSFSAMQRT